MILAAILYVGGCLTIVGGLWSLADTVRTVDALTNVMGLGLDVPSSISGWAVGVAIAIMLDGLLLIAVGRILETTLKSRMETDRGLRSLARTLDDFRADMLGDGELAYESRVELRR